MLTPVTEAKSASDQSRDSAQLPDRRPRRFAAHRSALLGHIREYYTGTVPVLLGIYVFITFLLRGNSGPHTCVYASAYVLDSGKEKRTDGTASVLGQPGIVVRLRR